MPDALWTGREIADATGGVLTGDWSVGVSGYRIANGVIDHPVSEITVAGNLIDIYARLIPGSDLEFRGSVNAPSVFVDAMSVGGL